MDRRDALSMLSFVALSRAVATRAGAPDDAGTVAVNVLLEPDAALAQRAAALNARLRAGGGRSFALDATHVPHISVVQQYVRRSDVEGLGAVIRRELEATPAPAMLEVTGLETAPWNDATMVSLRVEPVPALLHLQEALVAALIPFAAPAGDVAAFVRDAPDPAIDRATLDYVGGFVLKRTGDKYQPHLTVGLATAKQADALKAEPFERRSYAVSGVALYQLGAAGTARRRLWP